MTNMSGRLAMAAISVALFAEIWAPGGGGRLMAESVETATTAPAKPAASVRCTNLDEILGRVAPKTMFPLKTPHGTVDLPLDKVASITISGGPLEAGLAYYWPFDNKDAVDKIAGVKGRVDGPVAFAKGIVGLAPVFKNHTTRIVLQSPRLNFNGWKRVTLSFWAKFNSYSTYGVVFGRANVSTGCGISSRMGGTYGGRWIGALFCVRFPEIYQETVSPESLKNKIKPYPKKGV